MLSTGTFDPLSTKEIRQSIVNNLVSDDVKKTFANGAGQNQSVTNTTAIINAAMKRIENKTYLAYYPPAPPGMHSCSLTGGCFVRSTIAYTYSRTSCKRTPSGPEKSIRLREVSTYRRLKCSTLYVVGTMPKCLPMGGVCLQEVSVSGVSTVHVYVVVQIFPFFKIFKPV